MATATQKLSPIQVHLLRFFSERSINDQETYELQQIISKFYAQKADKNIMQAINIFLISVLFQVKVVLLRGLCLCGTDCMAQSMGHSSQTAIWLRTQKKLRLENYDLNSFLCTH